MNEEEKEEEKREKEEEAKRRKKEWIDAAEKIKKLNFSGTTKEEEEKRRKGRKNKPFWSLVLRRQLDGRKFQARTLYKQKFLRNHKETQFKALQEEGKKYNKKTEVYFWQNYYAALLEVEEAEIAEHNGWLPTHTSRDEKRRVIQEELIKRRKEAGFLHCAVTGHKGDFRFLRKADGPIQEPEKTEEEIKQDNGWNQVKNNKNEKTGWLGLDYHIKQY